MKFYRFGHIDPDKSLKVGDTVRSGQQIGTNGTGNGQWAVHCHFDILTYEPAKWTEYVIGKSLDWVKSHYSDPRGLEKAVLPLFDHLGYGWLEDANYTGGHAYHSGLDLNGEGAGNADLGDPILTPVGGVVRYVYQGTGKNEGWGGLVVIEEKIIEEPMQKEFVQAIEKLTGKDYGDNLNDKEQKDAAERLLKVKETLKAQDEKILDLNDEILEFNVVLKDRVAKVAELEGKLAECEAKVAQSQTEETPDSIDTYSLGELAGAFFRKLISIKK